MPVKTKIAKQILDEISSYIESKETLDGIVSLDRGSDHKECLSVEKVDNDEGYMTLLSEGSVLYRDNTIRLYIAKGTLTDWYNSIDDSFEGYVSTGHRSLDAFPVREGYFRKSDLKIITDENGRSDLLVKPHINTELSNVKDIIIQNEPFAISSEFVWYPKDITDEELGEYVKLVVHNIEHGGTAYVPITDKIEITGFSFVGNPGNAKSGGYEPELLLRNEEEHLEKKEILQRVLEQLSTEVKEDLYIEEVTEEVTEEEVQEVTEETVEETEAVEEAVEEVTETTDEVAETLAKVTARIEELEASNEQKDKTIADLQAKLAKHEQEEEAVQEQYTKLEKLLTKGSASTVSAKPEATDEKAEVGLFGRKRFGG